MSTCSSGSLDSGTLVDTLTGKYGGTCRGNSTGGVVRSRRGGSGGSSPGSRGHLGHDLDRLVSSISFSSPPHPSGRAGLGEYNFAGRCGVSSPLRSISSISDASFNTRRPDVGDGECKQAIYTEERKAHCQIKKTKQREENIEIPVKFPENTIKDQEEKTQTSSRSRIDGEVVDKRTRRPRIERGSKKIRLQEVQKHIQK